MIINSVVTLLFAFIKDDLIRTLLIAGRMLTGLGSNKSSLTEPGVTSVPHNKSTNLGINFGVGWGKLERRQG